MAGELNKLDISYIYLVDHSAIGAPEVSVEIKEAIRDIFKNTIIMAGGHTLESAEAELESGLSDLEAFGRPFICNPDLVQRFEQEQEVATNWDMNTFYSADEKGYTDYPVYQ